MGLQTSPLYGAVAYQGTRPVAVLRARGMPLIGHLAAKASPPGEKVAFATCLTSLSSLPLIINISHQHLHQHHHSSF